MAGTLRPNSNSGCGRWPIQTEGLPVPTTKQVETRADLGIVRNTAITGNTGGETETERPRLEEFHLTRAADRDADRYL